jgi:O-antigen/teichoic acid export membrane protein
MPAEAVEPVEPVAQADTHRPLLPDVVMTFATKVALLILNVATTVVVARALGTTGRGAVAVAFSFTLVLIQFGSFGLQTAAPYFASRDPQRLGRIVGNVLWFAFAIGALLILAGVFVRGVFPAALRGLRWLDVAIVLGGIPAAYAATLLQSILLAQGRMKAYNGVELVAAVLLCASLIVGFVAFDMGVVGAIALMVGNSFATAVVYLLLLRRSVRLFHRPDIPLARAMLRYGFRVYVATLIAYLVGRINLIFVNSYLGSSAAGRYSIGVALSEGIHLLPSVVALNLFPRVARGQGYEQSAAVFRSLSVLFLAFCLVTVPFAAPGIALVFGSDFRGAVEIYYWMLPGIYAYGMLNVLSYHFAGRGFPLEAMLIWIPGVLVNLAIVVAFVPGHGAWVAALASTVAYGLVLALHMRTFAKESGGYRVLVPRPRETYRLVQDMIAQIRPRTSG